MIFWYKDSIWPLRRLSGELRGRFLTSSNTIVLALYQRYSAEPAVFKRKALLSSVNRSAAATSLYAAARYTWKISSSQAKQAELVLPTLQGLLVGAFVADERLEATLDNFPGHGWRGLPG